jgi:transposase
MMESVSVGRAKRRPNFSVNFKKQVAQQACEPGVSVSQLARQLDINVNMLFKWRREWAAGLLDSGSQVMLPVTVTESPARLPAAAAAVSPSPGLRVTLPADDRIGQGAIEIEVANVTVRVIGKVDLAVLRSVLEMLRT